MKIAFYAPEKPRAQKALEELKSEYGQCAPEKAEALVVIGGDGAMLRALHMYQNLDVPLFGMNMGTLGFLLNDYNKKNLPSRIKKANKIKIFPLIMEAQDKSGKVHKELAYNEISLLRQTHNSAKIKISVNEKVTMEQLVCDGVLVSTPMGSTAYNSSAGGPIVPLDANVLPLTPISPFRPRRWPGALLRNDAKITFDVLRNVERPVSATADSTEVRNIIRVDIHQPRRTSRTLLFDPDNHLEERNFQEQFAP